MTDLKQPAAPPRHLRQTAATIVTAAGDAFMADCREINENLRRRPSAYDALPSDVEPSHGEPG